MKWKMLSLFIAGGLLVLLVAFVSKREANPGFEAAKEVIMMRTIAHRILQYTGDSTSRVMPVKTISATEFQVPFESSFSFEPDSLVKIIDRVIAINKPGSKYIVNVLECNTEKVIFGYAFLNNRENNLVPCLGRNQPFMRYCIDVKFDNAGLNKPLIYYVTAIGILAASLMILVALKQRKKKEPIVPEEKTVNAIPGNALSIGKYLFYPEQQSLVLNGENILLTVKESKLLYIFACNPNQIIDRNNLQKIWEDEGVIVGRSLDMFVSKLRKKLEHDAAIKLVNIHGKGYKLEITAGTV